MKTVYFGIHGIQQKNKDMYRLKLALQNEGT